MAFGNSIHNDEDEDDKNEENNDNEEDDGDREPYQEDFLKFDRVENKLSARADVHAFILLDKLLPPKENCPGCGISDMIAGADHDIVYLETDAEELAKVITMDQIIELIRCGVMLDPETDSLSMFV
jgi:hypothetical protein